MNELFKTPVLFIIFNRPDIAQKVFDQIKKIRPKYLYVAADGARSGNMDDLENCKHTREIINQVNWECEVKTLFRNENLGCGLAVCSAIIWFFMQVEQGIILEDDCMPDSSFFPFCGELLERYKEDESIYLISGTNLQNGIKRGDFSYYFSNYPITWGWASWSRAWNQFIYDIPDFDQSFKSGDLDHIFQSLPEKTYWRKKVKKAVLEKKNIWDYQWFFTLWKNKGIAITPNVNLITNIGFRNKAVHNFLQDSMREPSSTYPISFPLTHPTKKIDREADHFTFKNAFSHSINRVSRLIKENGIITVLVHTFVEFL